MNKTKLQNSWPAYSISLSSPTTLNYCKLGLCNKQHPESRLSMQLLQFPAPGWALEVLLKSKLKHLQRLGRGLGAPCNYQPAPEPGWLCRWETKHSQGRKFQKLNCCLGCGVGLGKEKKNNPKTQPKNTKGLKLSCSEYAEPEVWVLGLWMEPRNQLGRRMQG